MSWGGNLPLHTEKCTRRGCNRVCVRYVSILSLFVTATKEAELFPYTDRSRAAVGDRKKNDGLSLFVFEIDIGKENGGNATDTVDERKLMGRMRKPIGERFPL